jgi:hypothetical protein
MATRFVCDYKEGNSLFRARVFDMAHPDHYLFLMVVPSIPPTGTVIKIREGRDDLRFIVRCVELTAITFSGTEAGAIAEGAIPVPAETVSTVLDVYVEAYMP